MRRVRLLTGVYNPGNSLGHIIILANVMVKGSGKIQKAKEARPILTQELEDGKFGSPNSLSSMIHI